MIRPSLRPFLPLCSLQSARQIRAERGKEGRKQSSLQDIRYEFARSRPSKSSIRSVNPVFFTFPSRHCCQLAHGTSSIRHVLARYTFAATGRRPLRSCLCIIHGDGGPPRPPLRQMRRQRESRFLRIRPLSSSPSRVRRFLFLAFLAPLLFPLSAELLRDGRGRRPRPSADLSLGRSRSPRW